MGKERLRAAGRLTPGVLAASALGVGSILAVRWPALRGAGLSALTLAILGGMILGNTVYPPLSGPCGPGIQLAKQRFLRLGIVLYGFRLTLGDLASVGPAGILIDLLTLSSTFLLAWWIGQRGLGLDEETAVLVGAGSSICGAAAVLATEGVIGAKPERVAVVVATVVVFGTLSMFLYPILFSLARHAGLEGVTPSAYGIYAGSTIHEVAQVVAAGRAAGEEAASTAVIVKMIRVMLLAPFLLILSVRFSRKAGSGRGSIAIPWFAVGFLAVTGLNSLLPLPGRAAVLALDDLLLASAMGPWA